AGLPEAASKENAGRFALPERAPVGEPRAELFGPQSWQPPASNVAVKPPAPVAPPMPYQYAGRVVQDGEPSILLSKGDTVIPIKLGETLDGAYRVEAIGEDQITLIYLPLKHKQSIPVVSALAPAGADAQAQSVFAQPPSQATPGAAPPGPAAGPASVTPSRGVSAPVPTSSVVADHPRALNRPAQLLWEGPQQVRLGARFDVTLKVTSSQPLHASPMQLRFDPAYLEFVAARPGKFFGGGNRNFNYRANADGSIFVGASNQNPAAAAGAELLVLTFKPIKPAAAAELAVASLNLQGSAGQPIAFSQLTAFKTSITP
ncbi:MAG TPA: cohesin domain-containing protein, partial [Burkholderiales bacterium]|nr:cohesin domain-containing protein [Burkholderiales bacterium]